MRSNCEQVITEEQLREAGFVPVEEAQTADISMMNPEAIQNMEDFCNRVLWIDDDIDQQTNGMVMRSIIQWNRDDRDVPVEQRQPIYLFINSVGGEMSAAFALYNTIITSKTPVYGINMSYAFSAAFIVLLACHRRFGMPYSAYMMHSGSSESFSVGYKAAYNGVIHWGWQVRDMVDIVRSRTKITQDDAERYIQTDTYFDASDAYKLGIIDEIIVSIEDLLAAKVDEEIVEE